MFLVEEHPRRLQVAPFVLRYRSSPEAPRSGEDEREDRSPWAVLSHDAGWRGVCIYIEFWLWCNLNKDPTRTGY